MRQFLFHEQVNNKGLRVDLVFNCYVRESSLPHLVFSYHVEEKLWEIPCRLGAMIFFDYFSRTHTGDLIVEIKKVDWIPVDTNNLIVLFAVVKGLSDSLEFKIQNLGFDIKNGTFTFPEVRT